MNRHLRNLDHYYTWRQEALAVYPHVITLHGSTPIVDIDQWIKETRLDCAWHVCLFNVFDFQLGYDFFFRHLKDVSLFKLTWGGSLEGDKPAQFHLFYIS